MVICLERGADLHTAQLMPLPLTVSCFSKIQLVLPFWYRLTRVVKQVCVCVRACVCLCVCVSEHNYRGSVYYHGQDNYYYRYYYNGQNNNYYRYSASYPLALLYE